MKTSLPLTLCLMLLSSIAFSQKYGYSKGDKLLNVGIGVNSYYSSGFPLGASFEVGVTDEISVGASIDYLSSSYDYGFGSNYKFTTTYFGVRGSYHFNELLDIDNDKVDLYGGATLGFRSFKFKDKTTGISYGDLYGNGAFFGAFAGGKYYFSNNVAGFAEVGAIGSTNVRLGLGFKF